MKVLIFSLCFMMISLTVNSTVVYYPMNSDIEIEVPSKCWCIVYDSNYKNILSTDYNSGAEHYHCATSYAVAICTTEAEFYSTVLSIDPNYFNGPILPYFK